MTPNQKQLLSIIAAVAILAGGYVWASNHRKTSAPQPQNQVQKQKPSPVVQTNSSCKTAVYSDSNIGFSMNYFSDLWKKAQLPSGGTDSTFFSPSSGDDYQTWAEMAIKNDGVDYLSIALHRMIEPGIWDSFTSGSGNVVKHSFEDYLNSYFGTAKRDSVKVGSVQAVRMTYDHEITYVHGSGVEYSGPVKMYTYSVIFVPKKNGDYIVMIYQKPKDETMACSFDALLSSFKLK